MRPRGLPFVLGGSLLLALACEGGPDDGDDNTLRPRIGGPISDFPVRGGGLDAGSGPPPLGPGAEPVTPEGAAPGNLGGMSDTGGTGGTLGGGIVGGGATAGGGVTGGGGTVGGGTGGGASYEPSQDGGVPPASDAGTYAPCMQDASDCPTQVGPEAGTPTDVGPEASTPTDVGPEAGTPTEVGPEAGTDWPGSHPWPGWPGWHPR